MTISQRTRITVPLLFLAALACAAATGAALAAGSSAPAGPPVSARWVQRKINFVYLGLTAHYSCDGLHDNVRDILLELGARKKDLQLDEIGCVRLEGPTRMPGVSGTFWVLVPEDEVKTSDVLARPDASAPPAPASEPVQAQWRRIDVVRDLHYEFDPIGNCELLEQMKRQVLPMFSTRNLKFRSTCFPHTATADPVTFRLDVLVPVAPPKAGGG